MYKPKCVEPLLLVNQYALTLVQNGADIFLLGTRVPSGRVNVNHLSFQVLLENAKKYTDDDFETCYVRCDSIVEPLFIFAPCGRCEFCRQSKQVDLINRATLESQTWSVPPIFFTLTYKNECLPYHGELRYKDVQDFFKRLRTYWDRHHIKHDIRYLVAGEYGHRFGRPHYHIILFNNPYGASELLPTLIDDLKTDIFLAWNKCEWQALDIGQCRGGAAPYATKYVTKPCAMHGHWTKPFVRTSSGRRGGLGQIFFKDYISYLRENPSVNYIEYVDRQGNYQYMYLSKSFSRKVWPSPSLSVPAAQKELYRQLVDLLILSVEVGGMSSSAAYSLSQLLRPSRHVRNKFNVKNNILFHNGFCNKWLASRYNKLIGELSIQLAEVVEVDDAYIDTYYTHKSFMVNCNSEYLAQSLSKIREKVAETLTKCKL